MCHPRWFALRGLIDDSRKHFFQAGNVLVKIEFVAQKLVAAFAKFPCEGFVGEQLIDATVRVACLDSGTLKPRAIPKDLFTEWRNAQ